MKKYSIELDETFLDYPDPESTAIIVYMAGCSHHCPGCHSPFLQQDFEYQETEQEILEKIKEYAKNADTNKIVLLGGDPLYEKNIALTTYLIDNLSYSFDICVFTGFDIDYVKKLGIKGVKYYKCGTFDVTQARQSKKTDDEYVLASPNQDFYDGNYNKLSDNGILKFNNQKN